jgi:superoxide dismutase, Fe-Mn family
MTNFDHTMQAGTRNAIGGHYNHALFWTTLAPAAKSGSPSQALQKAIDDSFGSTDALKEKFNAAAAGR